METPKIDLTRVPMGPLSPEVIGEVHNLFEYHAWDEEKIMAGAEVRNILASAYQTILRVVPPCPTRTHALNNLVDARMLANAAITHDGRY